MALLLAMSDESGVKQQAQLLQAVQGCNHKGGMQVHAMPMTNLQEMFV